MLVIRGAASLELLENTLMTMPIGFKSVIGGVQLVFWK